MRRVAKEDGFTIVEVLVAAIVLVIGMLAVWSMIDGANRTTATAKQREGATNLAREVVEQARSISYTNLQQSDLQTRLQAMPGLEPAGGGSWQVTRREVAYTVTATVCIIDDPKDGKGNTTDPEFCPGQENPPVVVDDEARDYKQLSTQITWNDRGTTRRVVENVLVRPGATVGGPAVKTLNLVSPSVTTPDAPIITSTTPTTATFKVTAGTTATKVLWARDGIEQGEAALQPDGSYNFTLPLGGLSDGGYEISARAVDVKGVEGPTRTITLQLLRGLPSAPTGVVGGQNTVRIGGTPTVVNEIEWVPNPELNVLGYRVYQPDGALVCPTTTTAIYPSISCVDTTPAFGTYQIAATFKDINGVLQEGPRTSVAITRTTSFRSFYFTNQPLTAVAGSCPTASPIYAMASTFTGVAPAERKQLGNDTLRFCTTPGALDVPAGPAAATIWALNDRGGRERICRVTATLQRNTAAAPTLSGSVDVSTAVNASQAYTIPLGSLAAPLTLSATDRLNLAFTGSGDCGSLWLDFGQTTGERSRLDVPAPGVSPAPNAPTGLTATQTTEGVKLSWTAPANGITPDFYRIYRDPPQGGSSTPTTPDLDDRYDRVEPPPSGTTVEYTDAYGTTAANRYWVTAVAPALGESPAAGPVGR